MNKNTKKIFPETSGLDTGLVLSIFVLFQNTYVLMECPVILALLSAPANERRVFMEALGRYFPKSYSKCC